MSRIKKFSNVILVSRIVKFTQIFSFFSIKWGVFELLLILHKRMKSIDNHDSYESYRF